MYTLGGLLSTSDAHHVAQLLDWVVVSLDAIGEKTYAKEKRVPAARFQPVINAIEAMSQAPDKHAVVGVSFLLHEENWRLMPTMFVVARDAGADYVTFRPTIRTQPDAPSVPIGDRVWALHAADELERIMSKATAAGQQFIEASPDRFREWAQWEKHPYEICQGVKLSATITPNGKVWICPNRREMADSCLGDLREDSFQDIWARHPGAVLVSDHCRAMCKLHPVNKTLDEIALASKHAHADFI
jgi:MoaA/NifB/PqqE/SkfB family radical SAM enzyme